MSARVQPAQRSTAARHFRSAGFRSKRISACFELQRSFSLQNCGAVLQWLVCMTSCPGSTRSEGRHAHTCNDLIGFLDTNIDTKIALVPLFTVATIFYAPVGASVAIMCIVTYDKVVMQHVTSVLAGRKGLHSSLHAESAQQLQHSLQVDVSDGQQHTM
eukprot:365646-Chlamydomonas_euryale.AAC.2